MTTLEMPTKLSSPESEQVHDKTVTDFETIARTVIAKHALNSSVPRAAEVASVARLLADFPDLLNRLEVQAENEAESVAKPAAQTLSPEQVVNMARHHFATQAGIASSQHSQLEINRYLSENGIF